MSRNLIIAANWKMNKGPAGAQEFLDAFIPLVNDFQGSADIVLSPPFITIPATIAALHGNDRIKIAAQNVSQQNNGAYTGETSTDMLQEFAIDYVILGHSERRAIYGETDEIINAKINKALAANIKPIFCIGETLEEREGGKLEEVLRKQITLGLTNVTDVELSNIVIAYEPVWAIGTGVTATAEQAQDTHAFVRSVIADLYDSKAAEAIRIQYGGSVKPANAAELLGQPDIDGALVGGAALDPESFFGILQNSAS